MLLPSKSAWNSCSWICALKSARICPFLLFKENPDSLVCWVATWFFSAAWNSRTKFVHGSPRSWVTYRKGLSWQQTFFKRVICVSSVRWFFSLPSEQRWRERSADGLIVEFRVHAQLGKLWEGCFRPRGQTPHLAECQWKIASITTTWRKRFSSRFRRRDKSNTRRGTRQRTESHRTDNRTTWMTMQMTWNALVHIRELCNTLFIVHRKKVSVKCSVHTATVNETYCNKQLFSKRNWTHELKQSNARHEWPCSWHDAHRHILEPYVV